MSILAQTIRLTDHLNFVVPTYPSNHDAMVVLTDELERQQGWKPALAPFAHDFHTVDVEYRFGRRWTPKQRAAWESGDHQRGWMFGSKSKYTCVR